LWVLCYHWDLDFEQEGSAMNWLLTYYRSSVGRKTVMGLTGLMLVGFVATHLLGNFNIYLGQEALNAYAFGLKSLGPLVWVARIGLLLIFALHLATAFSLEVDNRKARPVGYAKQHPIASSFASRTMLLSASVILFFVLYHLAHFTLHEVGDHSFGPDYAGRHDVYRMVVTGFQDITITLVYIVSNLFLGLHMSHGIKSSFQSLGLRDKKYNSLVECGGIGLAWSLAIGNISIPIAVYFGCITL
jgi:succinate dehydrogenase / fumarate reductase, cytochrome b subunit